MNAMRLRRLLRVVDLLRQSHEYERREKIQLRALNDSKLESVRMHLDSSDGAAFALSELLVKHAAGIAVSTKELNNELEVLNYKALTSKGAAKSLVVKIVRTMRESEAEGQSRVVESGLIASVSQRANGFRQG